MLHKLGILIVVISIILFGFRIFSSSFATTLTPVFFLLPIIFLLLALQTFKKERKVEGYFYMSTSLFMFLLAMKELF